MELRNICKSRSTRRFRENVLIYPAERLNLKIEPVSSLLEWFRRVYNESDIVIFVGSAFRNHCLNEIISRCSKPKGKQMTIVSPNASELLDKLKNQFLETQLT